MNMMMPSSFRNQKERAVRIFTDREEPRETFKINYKSLKELRPLERPIKVLVYYGIGGIGKSRLLEELYGTLESQGEAVVLLDIEQALKTDTLLGSLKNLLVQKCDFKFPLFEYCQYYYRMKKGEDVNAPEIKSFIAKSPFLQAFVDIADQIPGLDFITKTLKAADSGVAFINNWVQNNKPELTEMRDKDAVQLSNDLVKYFCLDMEDNLKWKDEPLVIFLDTYEALVNEMSSRGEPLDNDIWLRDIDNGLIKHIPNVLWVIAGREKLKWDELDSRWGENLEQHLLDKLSSTNSMSFLKDSGITDEQLRKDLYVLTKGVPVYLDLCVDTYEAIKKEGKNPTITINDFGKNTKSLLGRFLKYMGDDIKELAYILSCLKIWDYELLKAVCPNNLGLTLLYEKMKGFSFVIPVGENKYRIHQAIGDVLYEECYETLRRDTLVKAIDFCKKKLDGLKVFDSSYIAYTHVLLGYVLRNYTEDKELAEALCTNLLNNFGEIAESAQFEELENLLNIAKNWCEEKKLQLAQAVILLSYSMLYQYKGEKQTAFNYAEKGYKELIGAFGDTDEITLQAKTIYANGLYNVDKKERALKLATEVLDIRQEKEPNKISLETIKLMNTVACFLSSANKTVEAVKMLNAAIELEVENFGENNSVTLKSKSTLADYLFRIREFETSIAKTRDVIGRQITTLGENHPLTIMSRMDLISRLSWVANFYRVDGSPKEDMEAEVEKLSQEAIDKFKEVLEEGQKDVLISMTNLSDHLVDTDQYDIAIKLDREVVDKSIEKLGSNDLFTIRSMGKLANHLAGMMKEEAKEWYNRVIEKCKEILGEDDSYTLLCMGDFADYLSINGDDKEATKLYSDVADKSEKRWGKRNITTLGYMSDFAYHLFKIGEKERAIEMDREVLAIAEEYCGVDDKYTIKFMSKLASHLFEMDENEKKEAIELDRDALFRCQTQLGKDHPDTIYYMGILCADLENDGQYEEAERLNKELETLYNKAKTYETYSGF